MHYWRRRTVHRICLMSPRYLRPLTRGRDRRQVVLSRADAALTVHQARSLTGPTHILAPNYIPSCTWPAPDLLALFAFFFACIDSTAHAVAASTILDGLDVRFPALRNACAGLLSCGCACKVMPTGMHRWCRSSMCGKMNQRYSPNHVSPLFLFPFLRLTYDRVRKIYRSRSLPSLRRPCERHLIGQHLPGSLVSIERR